jgi:hypothetical protein
VRLGVDVALGVAERPCPAVRRQKLPLQVVKGLPWLRIPARELVQGEHGSHGMGPHRQGARVGHGDAGQQLPQRMAGSRDGSVVLIGILAQQHAPLACVDGLPRAKAEHGKVAEGSGGAPVEAAAKGLRGVFDDGQAGQGAAKGRDVGADAVQMARDDGAGAAGPGESGRMRVNGERFLVHRHGDRRRAQAGDGREAGRPVDPGAEHLVSGSHADDLQADTQGVATRGEEQRWPSSMQFAEGRLGRRDGAPAQD